MDIKVGRNWGLFAAGIALVIIGFVLLMVPGLTLVSIAVIAGCMFLAAGIVDAYAYFKYREAEGLSGWALAYAICDIILGVLFIVHPVVSAVVIPWVMGIFVVAYGIFEIVAAVRFRDALPGWGWVLFAGIVSLFCGIAFFLWPGTFALFLGFFLMARGVQMAVYGVSLPQATIVAHHPLGAARPREGLRSEEATPARRGVGGTAAAPVIP